MFYVSIFFLSCVFIKFQQKVKFKKQKKGVREKKVKEKSGV